jgi:cytochrome oxidase Cu insertion factor (SCO1/SenC/PrrC family)
MGRATDEIAVSVEVQGRGSDPEDPPEEDPTDEDLAGGQPVVDRAAAFADNAPPIPRKFVYWVLAGAAVLGLGGLGLEHLLSAAGLNPTPVTHHASATTTTSAATPAAPAPLPAGQQNQINASLASFMDVSRVAGTPPPPIDLIDQSGQPYSLTAPSTKATVLTFFDGSCDDICPVLAAEIVQADTDLGAEAARVEFVTVNTDPSALSVSGLAGAEAASTLSALPNWIMLTGPLSTMDTVWKSYGISITVVQKTGVEAHNNLAYFIDPQGQEVYRATPFANESRSGTYSLPATEIDRWATGVAAYAEKVVGP